MKNKILILTILALCVLLCSCGKSEAIIAAENAIYAIGDVTLNSGPEIEKAEKAVEALSNEDKEKFEHYDKLEEIKSQYKQLEEENTIKELKNKIQGYWISGTSQFVSFENNKFSSGVYPGCVDAGEIKEITLDGEDRLKISVYYPESTDWDEVVPAYNKTINVITSNDNIITLTDENGKNGEYEYAGSTFEQTKKALASKRKSSSKEEFLLIEEKRYNRNGENYELFTVQKFKYDKLGKNQYVDELQVYLSSDIVSAVQKNGGRVVNPAVSRAVYDYDANDRIKSTTYYGYNVSGENTTRTTKYYYDDEGYISRSDDGDFITLYKKGEIVERYYYTSSGKKQSYTSSSKDNPNISYEYDEYGNKTRENTFKNGVLENYTEYIYVKK